MKKIERLLFWFKDGTEPVMEWDDLFYPYGVLLTRLLNEYYTGRPLQFINLKFFSPVTFDMFPTLRDGSAHYSRGHSHYNFKMDFSGLLKLSFEQQKILIWEKGLEGMKAIAAVKKNTDLSDAAVAAYRKGLSAALNPDFIKIDEKRSFGQTELRAVLWHRFTLDRMFAEFIIYTNGEEKYRKTLLTVKPGNEFFLEVYKKILITETEVILKGHYEEKNLPLLVALRQLLH